MKFFTFKPDIEDICEVVFKLLLSMIIYLEICHHIIEGYSFPWNLVIGPDESSTSQISQKEIWCRLKLVKNQCEIDIFKAIKLKDKNIQA